MLLHFGQAFFLEKVTEKLLNQYDMVFQLPTDELSAAREAEDRQSAETALVPPLSAISASS